VLEDIPEADTYKASVQELSNPFQLIERIKAEAALKGTSFFLFEDRGGKKRRRFVFSFSHWSPLPPPPSPQSSSSTKY